MKAALTCIFAFLLSSAAHTSLAQAAADSLSIPNVFTPNYDGVNDAFAIVGDTVTMVDCKIYNRYGTLVYEFAGVNDRWDGFTTAGELCKTGVYYYIATVRFADSRERTETGFVQLIR
ncbi:MAG: gliding motility-associated C-terminal domain-containing protein [Bacteroidota bacterium]